MKIHFIAIGGSAMHNLAIALHKKGYEVSGSDDEIFEPSKGRLKRFDLLPPSEGWEADRISADLDAVILGMHAREDNPELKKARELGLPIYSYPEFLYEQSKDKTRVVIAGSHGKTSITAMILHVLHYHNRSCDFMVGAQLEGFDTMVELSDENEFMLLEGDEYLSSPLDRRPKFIHYKANIALLSGIAWDHINVFPNYADYKQQFVGLLDSIEPGGAIIYNSVDPEVRELVEQHEKEIKKFAYGMPQWSMEGEQLFLQTDEGAVPLDIFGEHNLNNLEGARWICNQMGLADDAFYEAIGSFKGASRRLEPMDIEGTTAFRDFAHAPSKVKATVAAIQQKYQDKVKVACLELHTFSSLNAEFIKQYKGSMAAADVALVYFNPKVLQHKRLPNLEASYIEAAFDHPNLSVFNDIDQLKTSVERYATENAVLLLMSSGNFEGLDWKGILTAN